MKYELFSSIILYYFSFFRDYKILMCLFFIRYSDLNIITVQEINCTISCYLLIFWAVYPNQVGGAVAHPTGPTVALNEGPLPSLISNICLHICI